MKKTVIILLFFISLYSSFAQQNFTLYNMRAIPQSMYVNPAQIPASRINIGLPGISSLYTCVGNNGFKLDDLFKVDGNTITYNVDRLIGNLKKNNYITASLHIDLLSFGFKIKKNYFSFNLTEKADLWLRYPKAFLDFLWKGNGAFLGTEQNFNFGINATHYREWGFGYTRELNEKLVVGGRLKLLSGMENVSVAKSDVTFYTDPNDFSYKVTSNILVNTSADTAGFNHFNATNYLFNFSNPGLGLDLGANYKLNDKFSFSASLINLGYISWNSNTTNYRSNNPGATFVYKGVGLSTLGIDTIKFDAAIQKMTDSLQKTFDIKNNLHDKYTSYLPAQMYVGGNYAINEKNAAGLLLYAQVLDHTFRPGATVSISSRVGNALTSVLSYSMFNRGFGNIGFGFSVNAGPVQLYAVSDNILGMLMMNEYKSKNNSFVAPAYAKFLNVRAGINITIGRNTKDKDKDGVRDKEDDCPDTPGLKDFKGCPDKDGDKIPDKDDICPDVPGIPAFNGCPDSDGDGIRDLDDQCPNDRGPAYARGCPDADNDSIKDVEDECPQDAGPKYLKGCPDKDNDGIRDKDDKCPDKAGPAENSGCPYPRLIIIGSNGTIIDTISRNKNGKFIYEKLLADENVSFKLIDSDETPLDIQLVIAGKERKLTKDVTGNFILEKLPADIIKPEPQKEDTLRLNMTQKPLEQVKLKEEEKKILKTAFSNLEFESGKDIIKETSFASLTELANLLKQQPAWILRIAGHTDNVGAPAKNLGLSKRRAEAVRKFMMLSGINTEKFIIEYFGSSKPIADNKTPQGRQKNRRVEMTIVQNAK